MENKVDQWTARNLNSAVKEMFPSAKIAIVNTPDFFQLNIEYKGIEFGVIGVLGGFQSYKNNNLIIFGTDVWEQLKVAVSNVTNDIFESICENVSAHESVQKKEVNFEKI